MPVYTHGGDIYAAPGEVLDFSANQNPLGMPSTVREAARAAVDNAQRYPDSLCRTLRTAIGVRDGVSPEQVFCGNGAADVVFRLCAALHPRRALVTAPTFSEYEQALHAVGCEVYHHTLHAQEHFDVTSRVLQDLTQEVDLAFFCTPNNPTGRPINPWVLEAILVHCRDYGIRLVVDECFLHLSDGGGAGLAGRLAAFPNLILLRAFTKCYAMPGLRLGYSLSADEKLWERLYAVGQPWSVSAVAQAAGEAACQCPDWAEQAMKTVIRPQRARLTEELRALGADVWESTANYLLFRVPGMIHLKESMLARGILIRSCANYHGLGPDFYRIAVRLPDENRVLLQKLREVL